ncbi:MAG: glycoside hydrolase [Chitinophagaceae bacterium]
MNRKYFTRFIVLALLANVFVLQLAAQATGQTRIISADYNRVAGPLNNYFDMCVGAGRANEGLRADWQQQLALVKEQCGFRYLRMHGLLTDDMGVYFEDRKGNPVYNWQYIDVLFDYMLKIGVKPFVELGFMPNALASGNKTIFWWKGNITYPKDETKWQNLITVLVQHFKDRYGRDEVATWYFEVWNEPNLKDIFFAGSMEDYFKLYSLTAAAVKKVDRQFKVGGPATAGSAWIPEFLKYCKTSASPVDFVSTHVYGVKSGFVDADGSGTTVLSSQYNSIYDEVKNSRKQIEESGYPGLEMHYTEWSSSYTPTDPIHDSYHEAPYILDKLKRTGNVTQSMSYWTFTDIFEENGPRTTPFHGGFGLLNYQSIRKPAFYAYQFLHRLGNHELVNKDDASYICKNDKGNIQALCWNFTITHPGDSVSNQVFYKRDLPSKQTAPVEIRLVNIPAGKYTVNVYKTGYRTNDAYTTYVDMGSPDQLSPQQVKQLQQASDGKPVLSSAVTVDSKGLFTAKYPMRENDVLLVELVKK